MGKRGNPRQSTPPRCGRRTGAKPQVSHAHAPLHSSICGERGKAGRDRRSLSLGQDIRGLRHQLPIAGLNLLHNHSLGTGAAEGAGAPARAQAQAVVEARGPIGRSQSTWSGRDSHVNMRGYSHIRCYSPYLPDTPEVVPRGPGSLLQDDWAKTRSRVGQGFAISYMTLGRC